MKIIEGLKKAVGIRDEPEEQVERPANRRERRDWVRSCGRDVRLAYGFGAYRRVPPGRFIPPAGVTERRKNRVAVTE